MLSSRSQVDTHHIRRSRDTRHSPADSRRSRHQPVNSHPQRRRAGGHKVVRGWSVSVRRWRRIVPIRWRVVGIRHRVAIAPILTTPTDFFDGRDIGTLAAQSRHRWRSRRNWHCARKTRADNYRSKEKQITHDVHSFKSRGHPRSSRTSKTVTRSRLDWLRSISRHGEGIENAIVCAFQPRGKTTVHGHAHFQADPREKKIDICGNRHIVLRRNLSQRAAFRRRRVGMRAKSIAMVAGKLGNHGSSAPSTRVQ